HTHRAKIVHCDGVAPGCETTLATKTRQVRDDPHKDLLSRILGVLGAPKRSNRQCIDPVLHSLDERFNSAPVSGARTGNKRGMRILSDAHDRSITSLSCRSSDSSV